MEVGDDMTRPFSVEPATGSIDEGVGNLAVATTLPDVYSIIVVVGRESLNADVVLFRVAASSTLEVAATADFNVTSLAVIDRKFPQSDQLLESVHPNAPLSVRGIKMPSFDIRELPQPRILCLHFRETYHQKRLQRLVRGDVGILVKDEIHILGIVVRGLNRLGEFICSGREIERAAVGVLYEAVEFFAYFATVVTDSVFGHDDVAVVSLGRPVRSLGLGAGRERGKKRGSDDESPQG